MFISGLVIISIISSVPRTVFLLPFQLAAFCLSYLIHWPELQCLIEMMWVHFFAFFLILGENMQFFTIKYDVSYTIVSDSYQVKKVPFYSWFAGSFIRIGLKILSNACSLPIEVNIQFSPLDC